MERVAEYSYNPLPALAAQAVHFVFWGSLIFGAITVEKTNFDNIGWPGAILVRSFTYHIIKSREDFKRYPGFNSITFSENSNYGRESLLEV